MEKHYTAYMKKKFISQYKNGATVKELCSEYNLCKSSVYNWIKIYSRQQKGDNEIERLNHKINKLEKQLNFIKNENEILKRIDLASSIAEKEKINIIFKLRNEFTIHALCRALNVRRSNFYYYNRKTDKNIIEKEDGILKPKILEIFEKSKKRFGSKKIKVKLNDMGILCSPQRISRLMQEMGLTCNINKPQLKYPKANKDKFLRNKLLQKFEQTAPNKAWVSDITSIKVNYKTHFICVVIDLYSRKVIAYNMSDISDAKFVLEIFQIAYKNRNTPQSVMFHSDRGCQYTEYNFRKYLRELNINQSFSNTAHPYDNAVAESFFSALKR